MRKRRMGRMKGGGEGEEGRRLERRPGGFRSALACRHSYKSGADRRALARPEAPWCPVGARAACEVRPGGGAYVQSGGPGWPLGELVGLPGQGEKKQRRKAQGAQFRKGRGARGAGPRGGCQISAAA